MHDPRPDHGLTPVILPRYMRRFPKVSEVLPVLYLRGLTQIYLHADLSIRERAIARTSPTGTRPGRYTPPTSSSPTSRRSDCADLTKPQPQKSQVASAPVGIITDST